VKTINNRKQIRKQLKQEIMKTKIRTFIAVCVLSFVGLASASASTTEAINNSLAFSASESLFTGADFQKEAQLVNKWIVDQEEAKTFQRLVYEGFPGTNESTDETLVYSLSNAYSEYLNINLQEEAQMITKSIADQKEAQVISKLNFK
jgi:hypothetical protein